MVAVGVLLYKYSDDCPHGIYADLRQTRKSLQHGTGNSTDDAEIRQSKRGTVGLQAALRAVSILPVTWILAFQYACSFGVELQVHNVLSLYYYEDFTREGCVVASDATKCRLLTQTAAGLISSLFGLMCIFARAMGGMASDFASRKHGMKGRIVVQFIAFAGQAVVLFIYAHARTLGWSVPSLIVFGVFVQACTGTTFAIVPYVSPGYTGATSGIVGAGGNVGALCWGFLFKGVGSRAQSFKYMSAFVAASALLCGVTNVDGEGSVWHLVESEPATAHGRRRLIVNGFVPATDASEADDSVSRDRSNRNVRHQRKQHQVV